MGIYLGQLPPAEVARLKAELAETLIANFCYPRFFDHRTQSLCMRPVDRAKRQEVWMYLSAVDFTAWSRVDLTSSDLQTQIERLFIQFVQRNRAFFGDQGRKRMGDVRSLISSCASSVVQNLRSHLAGQKTGNHPFGSPRPVVSWSALNISGKQEPTWEQIAASTMALQQQLQELRGEIKPASQSSTSLDRSQQQQQGNNGRRMLPSRPQRPGVPQESPARAADISSTRPAELTPPQTKPRSTTGTLPGSNGRPAAKAPSSPSYPSVPQRPAPAAEEPKLEEIVAAIETMDTRAMAPIKPEEGLFQQVPEVEEHYGIQYQVSPPVEKDAVPPVAPAQPPRPVSQPTPAPAAPQPPSNGVAPREEAAPTIAVGDDDIAIFEQMRHQLILWLRIESVKAGLDIGGQSPSQLLEMLRQQGHIDETRLQVVSTLLNLSNQVIKSGQVSMMDYKQALMFHLMHTRR
ncbi:hypothetical protein EI42_05766 [Thermosporothrix hazakensis]|uniref:Uncharacterized protein n=3 Tax=Thermosporothrix TaxID=768650 RepID=A0A326TX00_THEHA|nr:hypothetical protein [Thermosporothrix hazakensis]PZW21004.1 hypothetical protein EI42_05766 [Thermosporothrix hazakensis]BBH91142.1 hypothetical protein KTC_58930 [Thermosporothrix sp. COM3]GCE49287.1 hypothetical protein KTH_41560 [Thermosporothrix hazakensis]